jgi:antitoxin VapB
VLIRGLSLLRRFKIIFVEDPSELTEKTERLREMMAREGLGGVLLNAQHNFAWLTGGRSNGIDTSRENGASFLLVTADGRRFSIANNIETPRLFAEEISAGDFEAVEVPWEAEKADPDLVINKAKALIRGDLVSDLPLHGAIRPVENLVAGCRYSLTAQEVERYRGLGSDTGEALARLAGLIAPGKSEIEIARIVRDALAEYGIRPVVLLVGADERIANFRHPVPTGKIWDKVLLVAVCAKRAGLIASASRIFCTGDIPAGLQRRTEAAAYVFGSLLAASSAGTSGAELYETAEQAYNAQGFAGEIRRHHQGGACGYRTRDWVAHPGSGETVRQDQAFAWNPSITGTKVEETAIITSGGAEIITASPGWPQIRARIGGKEYISPGILSL